MNKYFKDKIAERRDSHSLDSTNGFIQGISVGIEFACAHLCRYCKDEGPSERISEEQIEKEKEHQVKFPGDGGGLDAHLWRHARREHGVTPLCKSSSLREAWRNDERS